MAATSTPGREYRRTAKAFALDDHQRK